MGVGVAHHIVVVVEKSVVHFAAVVDSDTRSDTGSRWVVDWGTSNFEGASCTGVCSSLVEPASGEAYRAESKTIALVRVAACPALATEKNKQKKNDKRVHGRAVYSVNCYVLIVVMVPRSNPGKGWSIECNPVDGCTSCSINKT